MSPEQQTIFTTLTQDIKQQNWVDLGLFVGMVYFPSAAAFITKLFDKSKVEALYKLRLSDKDKVISDQSERIKQLEETILKRPRK